MLKHYLQSALRHFARHKATTIINVLCLALGFVCFAVAFGIVEYYRNADLYHEKGHRTYVITTQEQLVGTSTMGSTIPFSGLSVGPLLKAEYSDLEIVARATSSREIAVATTNAKVHALAQFADPEYLDTFDLPFVAGDSRAALRTPRSAVIRDDFARLVFGDANPMGRALLINGRETVHVTGVIRTPLLPTHIAARFGSKMVDFSMLVSMDTRDALFSAAAPAASANAMSFGATTFTYVVFRSDSALRPDGLRADLSRFANRHVPKTYGEIKFGLRPVSEVLEVLADFTMRSDKSGLSSRITLLILGALALIAACLNYANLASALASTRMKELAMRRVMGAGRRQIALQALFEAAILVSAAALIVLAVLPPLVSSLSASTGLDIGSQLYPSIGFWVSTLALVCIVAVLACSYPAVVSTQVQPAHALQRGGRSNSKRRVMYGLVVAQFAIASFLFVTTDVMHAQNERMKPTYDTGDDQVVVINSDLKEAGLDVQVLQDELRRHSAITRVSAIDMMPGELVRYRTGRMLTSQNADATRWKALAPSVDYGYFETTQVKLLAGRDFDPNVRSDLNSSSNTGNVIIDRAMAEEYGWSNPASAIGRPIFMSNSSAKDATGSPHTVIGVVENSVLVPMVVDGRTSTVYSLDPDRASILMIRISRADVSGGIRAIENTWNSLAPNIPLKRRFLDEQFEESQRWISGVSLLFRVLAFIAMMVGALGLIGIATHAMNQRQYEIGVRRALGASVRQVLAMLLTDFGKPILIANLIAWPLAYSVAKTYTSFFSDRAAVTLAPFVLSLVVGLGIAWLAVLRQATSAARTNPATVLRHD